MSGQRKTADYERVTMKSGGMEPEAGNMTEVVVGREHGEVVLKRKRGDNQVAHRQSPTLAA
jgi:hypothetical protein